MKQSKTIGWLLIAGTLGVLVPYTILTIIFDYPDILREDAGVILTRFHEGGNRLICTWWAFAMLGLPLLKASVMLGHLLEHRLRYVRWATTLGIIGLLVQLVGLLRWTFVVPVLANHFVTGDAMVKTSARIGFELLHQYAGVALGEHLGQLFSIGWTIVLSAAFAQLKLFPKWISWLGYTSGAIYLLAQAEAVATVVPGTPMVPLAGLVGSTLWLVWLMAVGIQLLRRPMAPL